MKTEQIKKMLKSKPKENLSSRPLLSSGSTLLNLACSGKASGAFPQGSYIFLVGDSASGKSFLSLTCLAEAMKSKHFANHRIIYDDVEGGAMMDWEKFFGQRVADKVEQPGRFREGPCCSETIEDFYFYVDDAIKMSLPFIYILDSMDALSTGEEVNKFQEQKAAKRKGKETTGTYGTSKAKANSAGIRQILTGLRKTGSILIVISQTRDNIGFGAQFNPKSRSGGHALTFYAHLELWSSIVGQIKKTVMGKPRQLGITARIKVKKNRLNGKLREVDIPILWSAGIDDTGSCVGYLIEEGHWTEGDKGGVGAPEFKWKGSREKLIQKIEAEGLEKELRAIVGETWNEVEMACAVKRKIRYT
jgi:RecA/RadA recombinase